MNQLVTQNDETFKISPEALEVANSYMQTLKVEETARNLSLPVEDVIDYINNKEIKRYIDTIFLEQGYLNRYTLQNTLTNIIEKKLEECVESEMYSNKDIVDLLEFAHKIRMDEIKAVRENEKANIGNQINIQNNFGQNYSDLMQKLLTIE